MADLYGLGPLPAESHTLEGTLAAIPGLGSYIAYGRYLDAENQRKRALQEQEAFRQERGALGPGATPEDMFRVGARYSSPADLMGKSDEWAKLIEAKKTREAMQAGLERIMGGGAAPAQAPAAPSEPAPLGIGFPAGGASEAPAPSAPAPTSPADRVSQLKQLSMLYAGYPAVVAAINREIDKLETAAKPMVEHNYPIGGNKVQPHISYDSGRTWQPIPGSQPSDKFNRTEIGTAILPQHAGLHGAEYLATLPTGTANTVKLFAEYRAPLSTLSTRTGERQAMLERVSQYDPNFDVKQYQSRQKVVNDFTSGPTANNLTALDQALNHMGTLKQLATALQNNDVPAVNAIVNTVRKQTGDPRVTNYATAQTAVATELMRVFRQVNASEQETKDWMSKFPINGSPSQIIESLGTGAKLLDGRVNALNNRWNNGMGVDTGYPRIMSPQAKAALDDLLGKGSASSGGGWTQSKEQRYQELLRKRGGS